MKMRDAIPPATSQSTAAPSPRGQLFRKYVGLFVTVVCAALVANGLLDIWFSYREMNILLTRIQQEQAKSAAAKISQYIKEIEGQLAWATLLPWSTETLDEWKMDAARLLRLVPAVTAVAQLDAAGREEIRASRVTKDEVGSQIDYSQEDFFAKAVANKVYYGPVHFLRESEPYMTIAMAGVRRDRRASEPQIHLGCGVADSGRHPRASLCGGSRWPADRSSGHQHGASQYGHVAARAGPGGAR
jgi:two-component system NtrC family sensor kinase